jgi:protein-S-isoprenylcysteine O-methyltransferase Ste14
MSQPRLPWWKGERGEWWVAGQAALIAALALAPTAWSWTAPSRGLWRGFGGLLILAGLAYAARAVIELGHNLTAFPRPRRNGFLVQTGLYAQVRHPIYGGLIIAAFGWSLWRGSGLHVGLAAALAVYVLAKAGREEAFLAARFPEYEAYRARTKRLVPRVF